MSESSQEKNSQIKDNSQSETSMLDSSVSHSPGVSEDIELEKELIHEPKEHSIRELEEIELKSTSASSFLNVMDITMQANVAEESTELTMTDPGKLFFLLSILHDTCSIGIQMKINKYLETVTKSKMAFFIYFPQSVSEGVITVLSNRVMDPALTLEGECDVVREPLNKEAPMEYDSKRLIDQDLLEYITKILNIDHKVKFESLIMVPVLHPIPNEVNFLIGLVNAEEKVNKLSACHTYITECLRFCLGTVLNSFIMEEESAENEVNKSIQSIVQKAFSHIGDFQGMVKFIEANINNIFNTKRTTILIMNEYSELVSKISNFGPTFYINGDGIDVKVTKGNGILGKLLESQKIYNCKNTKKDSNFDQNIDGIGDKTVRCILAGPINWNNQIMGVIALKNKLNGSYFSKWDEKKLNIILPFLGELLYNSLQKRKSNDLQEKRSIYLKMLLQQPLEKTNREIQKLVDFSMSCQGPHEYYNMNKLTDIKFDPLDIPEEHTICIIYKIFSEFGLLKQFEINEKKFTTFLVNVRNAYTNVPVHNWYHGFSSMHFIFTMLNNISIADKCGDSGYMSLLECLSLLLASLGHDVQFRESVSQFQATRGTCLASLYSSPGAIQQHYSNFIIWGLLASEDSNILDGLDKENYILVKHWIGKMILATDLGEFLLNIPEYEKLIENGYNKDDHHHHLLLHSLMMTCSCLNGYAKPWPQSSNLGPATFQDFYTKQNWDEIKGFFEITGVKPSKARVPNLQIQFLTDICSPAFQYLSDIFIITKECYERVKMNIKNWENMNNSVVNQKQEVELVAEVSDTSM